MRGGIRTLILLVFLLVLPVVVAETDFNLVIEPSQQTIKLNETAVFDLTISHNSAQTEYFEIYSPDVLWDISTDPTTDRVMQIPAGQSRNTKLLIRPLYVQPGFYGVVINVKMSGSKQLVQKDLRIGVARETFGEYMPAIRSALTMPEKIYPNEEITLKVRLENQNRRDLDKLDLKLRSQLINKDYTTSLKPLESKEVEFKVKLDEATPPQQDQLRISVFADVRNRTSRFDLPIKRYMVLPYGDVTESREETSSLLWKETKIMLKNTGNVVTEELVEYPTNVFSRWFTDANFDYAVISTGTGRYLTWKMKLGAMEEETVTVTENYWPAVWFLLTVGIIVGLYYMFRSPLVVKKGAMVVQSREGEISELKVFITMRNRSRNSLHDIIVLDMVPPFADVKHQFEVGTLNPDKVVRHDKKGTQLKWSIDVLEPHEERIMSYKIKTRISILGGFKLPPCQVKFKFFNYERLAYSAVENLFNR
ncbi:MAG: hypothetical protein ACE5FT_05235 [Candidatus Nanoarchaeia archaeon]